MHGTDQKKHYQYIVSGHEVCAGDIYNIDGCGEENFLVTDIVEDDDNFVCEAVRCTTDEHGSIDGTLNSFKVKVAPSFLSKPKSLKFKPTFRKEICLLKLATSKNVSRCLLHNNTPEYHQNTRRFAVAVHLRREINKGMVSRSNSFRISIGPSNLAHDLQIFQLDGQFERSADIASEESFHFF